MDIYSRAMACHLPLLLELRDGGNVEGHIEIKARLPRIEGSARKATFEAMRPQGRAGASSRLAC